MHLCHKKRIAVAWILIGLFQISAWASIEAVSSHTMDVTTELYHRSLSPPFGYDDGPSKQIGNYTIYTKGLAEELLKIIIGVPTQIDQNENISIFVSGMRNAKAQYVQPENITVELVGLYPNQFEDNINYVMKLGSFVFSTASGRKDSSKDWGEDATFQDGSKWIPNNGVDNQSLPVDHVGYDIPIFKTNFQALGFKATVMVRVTFTWKTPWFEVLSQIATQQFQVAPWYDFDNFLHTNEANIQDTFGEFDKTNTLNNAIHSLQTYMNTIDVVWESTDNLQNAGTLDPAVMHIYLLNISSIVDPTNPNSYVSQLPSGTDKTNLINVLAEINTAYQQSKQVLLKKGIDIVETYVNYTYENHWDASALDLNGTDIKYTDITDPYSRDAVYDADWDEEHQEDCSLEFIMEGKFWSGNPYLKHEPYKIKITGTTFPDSIDLGSSPYYTIENLMYTYTGTNTTKHTSLYDGYYTVYKINKTSGEKTAVSSSLTADGYVIYDDEGVAHNRGNVVSGSFSGISSALFDLYIEFITPGGYRKANKAVVMNLMYDLFPLLTRTYGIPHNVIDPAHQYTYPNSTVIDIPDRYAIDTGNRYYNMFGNKYNETRLFLDIHPIELIDGYYTQLSGNWYFNRDNIINVTRTLDTTVPVYMATPQPVGKQIFHMNITHYFQYLADGFSEGNPFFINFIGKPFGKLVYDSNTVDGFGNNYNGVVSDKNFTEFIDDIITTRWLANQPSTPLDEIPTLSFILDPKWDAYPFFALADKTMHLTNDPNGGTIYPTPTYAYQNFYKTDVGKWIEAFFNGTVLNQYDDPAKSPDFIETRLPNGDIIPYTLSWIDTEAVSPSSDQSSIIPEYSAVPFQGPSDYPPLGAIITDASSFIQIASKNLTTGLSYGYGLIYLAYRVAYDYARVMLSDMIVSASNPKYNKTYAEIVSLQKDIANLEIAWETLDTVTLNQLMSKVYSYTLNASAITAIPNQWYNVTEDSELYNEDVEVPSPQSASYPSPISAGIFDNMNDDGYTGDQRNTWVQAKAGVLYRGVWTTDYKLSMNPADKTEELYNYFIGTINNVYWDSNQLWLSLDSIEHPNLYQLESYYYDEEKQEWVYHTDIEGNRITKTKFNFVDFTFISQNGKSLYLKDGSTSVLSNGHYVYEDEGILIWNSTNIYKPDGTYVFNGVEKLIGQSIIFKRARLSAGVAYLPTSVQNANKVSFWVGQGLIVNPNDINRDDISSGIQMITEALQKVDAFTQQLIQSIKRFIDKDLRNILVSIAENFISFFQDTNNPLSLYNLTATFSESIPEWAMEKYKEYTVKLANSLHPLNKVMSDWGDWMLAESSTYEGYLQQDIAAFLDLSGETRHSDAFEHFLLMISAPVRRYIVELLTEKGIFASEEEGEDLGEEIVDFCSDPLGYIGDAFEEVTGIDTSTTLGWINNKFLSIKGMIISVAGIYVNRWLGNWLKSRANQDWLGLWSKMDDMLFSLFNGMAKMSDSVGQTFQRMFKFIAQTTGQLLQQALTTLDSISQQLTTIQNLLQTINDYLNQLIADISARFNQLGDIISKVGDILIEIVSSSINWVVDRTKDIFPQLQKLEDELLANDHFLTIMDFFYPPFTQARLASGYIDYSLAHGQMSEDTYYQFVNIYKPLAEIDNANTGFKIYQIGTEFAQRLYFITTVNGSLVDVPLNITVKHWLTNYTLWGIPEENFPLDEFGNPVSYGAVEGILQPLNTYNTSKDWNSLTPAERELYKIPGLYYINLNTETAIDWYINNTDGYGYGDHSLGEWDAYTPPSEGFYMTMAVSEFDEAAGIKYDSPTFVGNTSHWSELTYLFSAQFVEDAFVLMDVNPVGQEDEDYLTGEAGGDPVEFLITLENLMYSEPEVTLRVKIDSESGTPIYQKEYYGIRLSDNAAETLLLNVTLGKYTPGGTHIMTIAVYEANGDFSSRQYYIVVTGADPFTTFFFGMFSGYSLYFMIGGLGCIITGSFYYRNKKINAMSKEAITFKTYNVGSSRSAIQLCSYEEIKSGKCKFKLPSFNRGDWVCDPDTKQCYNIKDTLKK